MENTHEFCDGELEETKVVHDVHEPTIYELADAALQTEMRIAYEKTR
jgi:hypothetical protein